MEFYIYRDWTALRFIRCLSPVKGSTDFAGGSALTLSSALARCRAEVVERTFLRELAANSSAKVIASAAHPFLENAILNAQLESAEEHLIGRINATGVFKGFPLFNGRTFKVWIRRTNRGWACFIVGRYKRKSFGTLSVRSTLVQALMKTWEEYRNVHFFKPTLEDLRSYTRVNRGLNRIPLTELNFRWDFGIEPELGAETSSIHHSQQNGHHIAYVIEGVTK